LPASGIGDLVEPGSDGRVGERLGAVGPALHPVKPMSCSAQPSRANPGKAVAASSAGGVRAGTGPGVTPKQIQASCWSGPRTSSIRHTWVTVTELPVTVTDVVPGAATVAVVNGPGATVCVRRS
jgi:hypothetical protein